MKIRIKSERAVEKLMLHLISLAIWDSRQHRTRPTNVGIYLNILSDDEKELIKTLTSEQLNNIRMTKFPLDTIWY